MNKIEIINMKNLFSFFAFMLLTATLTFAQTKDATPTQVAKEVITEAAPTDGPVMEFEATEVDYGTIEQHSDPLRTFHFKNTGTAPLVIKQAKGSCGCTVPTYPKEPIAPGEKAVIEVRYDTKRIGSFTKTVTLTTNEGDDKRVIRIKGKVNAAPKEDAGVPASSPSILSPDKKN